MNTGGPIGLVDELTVGVTISHPISHFGSSGALSARFLGTISLPPPKERRGREAERKRERKNEREKERKKERKKQKKKETKKKEETKKEK